MEEIDNPGSGDCGYYAFENGLLPHILRELKLIVPGGKLENLSAIEDPGALFGALTNDTTPILYRLYLLVVEQQLCRLDKPESSNISPIDPELQKALLFGWLKQLAKIKNPYEVERPNRELDEALTRGVYLLRTLLAKVRLTEAQEAINGLRVWRQPRDRSKEARYRNMVELYRQFYPRNIEGLPEKTQAAIRTLEERKRSTRESLGRRLNADEETQLAALAFDNYLTKLENEIRAPGKNNRDVFTEAYKRFFGVEPGEIIDLYLFYRQKITEDTPVAKRSDDEARAFYLEESARHLNHKSGFIQDINTVFLFYSRQTTDADNDALRDLTTQNPTLHTFTLAFTDWWKANAGTFAYDQTKMKMAFIACFYGALEFKRKTFAEVIDEAHAWWDNPFLSLNSPAIIVADAVTQMGTWATERDVAALAGIIDGELNIHGRIIHGSADARPEPDKPVINVRNYGNNHWVTLYTPKDLSQFENTDRPQARAQARTQAKQAQSQCRLM